MIHTYLNRGSMEEKTMTMSITARHARRIGLTGAIIVTALGLAGCTNPYDPGQRALGGGAIGAGAGAAIGAATGGSPAAGALIGGAVGALGGALTTPQPPQQGYYNQGYNNGPPPPRYYNNGGPPSPPPGYYNNGGPPPPPPQGYYNNGGPPPPGY